MGGNVSVSLLFRYVIFYGIGEIVARFFLSYFGMCLCFKKYYRIVFYLQHQKVGQKTLVIIVFG